MADEQRAVDGIDPVDTQRTPVPAYSWYVLGVLFLVYVFNFIDRNILSILMESIKEDLDLSDKQLGLLSGFAFAIFYSLMGLPLARWADTGSRRTIIALGLAVWSVMTAASGLARNYVQIVLARIGVGVGEAAGSPPAHSLISDYFPPERRGTALAIYSMGIYGGILFGFTLGGWLDENVGWRMAFMVVGLPGVLLALLVRFTVKEPPRGQTESGPVDAEPIPVGETLRFLIARRSFLYLQIGGALHAFASYGVGSWVAVFLRRVHDMGSAEIGYWLGALAGAGGALGVFLGGILADRLVPRDARWYMWLPILAAVGAIPFTLAFLLLDNTLVALLCYLPHAIISATYNGPVYAMTQAVVKVRMRAFAVAVHLLIVNLIGLGLGPLVVGAISDWLQPTEGVNSIRYALLVVAITNVVACIFYFRANRTLAEDLASRDD
ncbi:MFS transporter [Myxococcota bacterium]|nr:MFS transporter [Myxococcota bacterium]